MSGGISEEENKDLKETKGTKGTRIIPAL